MLPLTARCLLLEIAAHRRTGGVSAENKAFGFQPAFLDTATAKIYPSTFADCRPAPFHLLEGLPDHLAVAHNRRGCITQVVGSVIAGFLRDGVFYTRKQAAEAVAEGEAAKLLQLDD